MNSITAIKNSFKIVWKNLILAQPPILFLLVMTLLMSGFNRFGANNIVTLVFGASLIFLAVAFLAGWFYMVKKTIAYDLDTSIKEEEKAIQSFGNIKHFFPGVGEYFLTALGAGIILVVASFIVALLAIKFDVKFFGPLDIEFLRKSMEINTGAEMQLYLNSLSEEKLMPILTWFVYFSFVQIVGQFVIMWWFPAMLYNTKNPLWALVLNFKFLFKHFFASVGIILFLVFLNIVISLITSIFGTNVILSLISFLLFFFYVTYSIVLIFLYYGQNGESTAKDYIDSGDDCDGKKLAGSESGEEN